MASGSKSLINADLPAYTVRVSDRALPMSYLTVSICDR